MEYFSSSCGTLEDKVTQVEQLYCCQDEVKNFSFGSFVTSGLVWRGIEGTFELNLVLEHIATHYPVNVIMKSDEVMLFLSLPH